MPRPSDELRALMREQKLTRARVAQLLGVSPKTVDSWLTDKAWRKEMPPRHLEFLRLKLAAEG